MLYDEAIAAGQTQVVVYGPPPARALLDTFRERFPGIEVTYQQPQSAERLAKLEQEKQTGKVVMVTPAANDAFVPQEVASGNYPIGALAYYPYFVEIKAQGAPIEFVFPFAEGGGNMWTKSAQCLLNDSPNPLAASLYMYWEFSNEGQQALSDAGPYPVMPGTPGPGGLPPLDSIDLLEQLPDIEAISAYGSYVRDVIELFTE